MNGHFRVSSIRFQQLALALLLMMSLLTWGAPAELAAQSMDPRLLQQLQQGGYSPMLQGQSLGGLGQNGQFGQGATPNPALSPLDRLRQQRDLKRAQDDEQKRLKQLRQLQGLEPLQEESPLEEIYGKLLKLYLPQDRQPLRHFGYDIFATQVDSSPVMTGAVGDDYVLGIGDQLVVTLHGQVSESKVYQVDREGRLYIPQLGPVAAAGQRFSDLRGELKRRVEKSMLATELFLSIGQVRMMDVMVAGEVKEPGVYQLPSLSTLLDALSRAGGIKQIGSLRNIRVLRGGKARKLDLYNLLFDTNPGMNLTIQPGDRIIVPPIGDTVAVAGDVKRSGIYELNGRPASLARILKWAGGPLRAGENRVLALASNRQGEQSLVEPKSLKGTRAKNGTLYLVRHVTRTASGNIRLVGHVHTKGLFSLSRTHDLKTLLGKTGGLLKPNAYLPFAVIHTTDPVSRVRRLEPISLLHILQGKSNRQLRDGDELIVLGQEEVRYLSSPWVAEVLKKAPEERYRYEASSNDSLQRPVKELSDEDKLEQMLESRRQDDISLTVAECKGLKRLSYLVRMSGASRFLSNHLRYAGEEQAMELELECPFLFNKYPDMLPLMLEHAVLVSGEVRDSGLYPVANAIDLGALIATAGDFTLSADRGQVELQQLQSQGGQGGHHQKVVRNTVQVTKPGAVDIAVHPRDSVRVHPVYSDLETDTVLVLGELRRPGHYSIRRGERLSELLKRAGGLTPYAYPYGAVLSRESVKKMEKEGFLKTAKELKSQLASSFSSSKGSKQDDVAEQIKVVGKLIQDLESAEPAGRVEAEFDPLVLQRYPERDLIIEPGDVLRIPKRPNFVTVSGEVLHPGNFQHLPGKDVQHYLASAGGFREYAEEDRIFLVKPNGAAQPLKPSMWDYTPVNIPPGSLVVVPKELRVIEPLELTVSIANVLKDLAVSAASIAVINK
uniref:Putative periplasmic protein involved in polysaccharide export n=1 Tax=Magnetococcus massalia (strain MO-1) TaxID=451514 RepID=A0A1S7LJ53_MAGMO|nr:putative periplasmic protein involved in polysaccharide export [Candidatus Magnetococcus massalia]